ncbi:hypothetical protein [Herminiimonas contaminans]|nr:hypothetical protein [Herminiimonas contaminans]
MAYNNTAGGAGQPGSLAVGGTTYAIGGTETRSLNTAYHPRIHA